MIQEDKELLLKDLCARLPYGVKVKTYTQEPYTLKGLFETEYNGIVGCLLSKHPYKDKSPKTTNYPLSEFKPYLFPLSSMTLEQRCKVRNLLPNNCDISFKNQKITFYNEGNIQLEQLEKIFNFFNLYHIDYRGLIEKGLAIDATEKNIY